MVNMNMKCNMNKSYSLVISNPTYLQVFYQTIADSLVMERQSGGRNFLSASLDKLCYHRRLKRKETSRVVFNNVSLEETSEHDIPPQKFYKTNVIKVIRLIIFEFSV